MLTSGSGDVVFTKEIGETFCADRPWRKVQNLGRNLGQNLDFQLNHHADHHWDNHLIRLK